MEQYLDILRHIRENGKPSPDRTGTGRTRIFGSMQRYNLQDGFPILTSKQTMFKGAIAELLWFLEGSTNVNRLKEIAGGNLKFWDRWATETGDLGPIYGTQWTRFSSIVHDGNGEAHFKKINQIDELIKNLNERPFSARHIVTAWNPADLPDESKSPQENVRDGKMALAACHCLFQFFVAEADGDSRLRHLSAMYPNGLEISDRQYDLSNEPGLHRLCDDYQVPKLQLSCLLFQRSSDKFVGEPVNIVSYSLLTHMVAQVTGMIVGDFVHMGGDVHIYHDQLEGVDELLSRTPGKLPKLKLNQGVKSLKDFKMEDFELVGYDPQPAIAAPVSV